MRPQCHPESCAEFISVLFQDPSSSNTNFFKACTLNKTMFAFDHAAPQVTGNSNIQGWILKRVQDDNRPYSHPFILFSQNFKIFYEDNALLIFCQDCKTRKCSGAVALLDNKDQ